MIRSLTHAESVSEHSRVDCCLKILNYNHKMTSRYSSELVALEDHNNLYIFFNL